MSVPARSLWLGTSWKMTKTIQEARAYVAELGSAAFPPGVQVFLIPPVTALHAVRGALPAGSRVLVGVQNAHWAPDGPVTGEVSMNQVRDAGAEIVEIGHSDRRSQFGETDQTVAAKVTAALEQQLIPLVCVGEPWSAREAGRAGEHVADQVRIALAGLDAADLSRVLVAYEPVWAIGDSGRAAAPGDIVGVLDRIRSVVADLMPSARLRGLLYGGSVSTANAAALLRLDDLDGLFVGRAAWSAAGLGALLDLCGQAAVGRARAGDPRPDGAHPADPDSPSSTHEHRSR